MPRTKYEFTNVTSLTADAIGEPGNRTFRILATSRSSSAIVRVEKAALFQLALATKQLQASLPATKCLSSSPPSGLEAPPLTKLDITPDKIVFGYSESTGCFTIEVSEAQDRHSTTLKAWVGQDLMEAFTIQAMQVCYAGRPLCRLCGGPMEPSGHRCPMVNGRPTGTHVP